MAVGIKHTGVTAFEHIRKQYNSEQILTYFGVPITARNKCLCPFHNETEPSMQVNEKHVYCFGCKGSWDVFSLAQSLLEKQNGTKPTVPEVIEWFDTVVLPDKTERSYEKSFYEGAVNPDLVNYWHSRLSPEQYQQLADERLLTKETVDKHLLGWRPDWRAWSIPFIAGDKTIDIVQFRMTEPTAPKYLGLKGHSRGSVMNADLLLDTQEYLVIFFGAFDAILARQDGLPAVGLNGSTPFKRTENARVKELFSKQHTIYVVPDNTTSEFVPAQQLAELLGGEVRYFPINLPEDTDYIDYRKLGYTANDFLRDVLDLAPITTPDMEAVANVVSLLRVGDPFGLSTMHVLPSRGTPARDFALAVAEHLKGDKHIISRRSLREVKTTEDLYLQLESIAQRVYTAHGGW